MNPYALKHISDEELKLFEDIRTAVSKIPDGIDLGKNDKGEGVILSCHILARAVAKVFVLQYVDGYVYPSFEHSWLETKSFHVIDVYPVATLGGPIMIVGSAMCGLTHWHYKKRRLKKLGFNQSWFRQAVKKIVQELRLNQK